MSSSREIGLKPNRSANCPAIEPSLARIRARLAKGRKRVAKGVSTNEERFTGSTFTTKTESESRSLRKVPIDGMLNPFLRSGNPKPCAGSISSPSRFRSGNSANAIWSMRRQTSGLGCGTNKCSITFASFSAKTSH